MHSESENSGTKILLILLFLFIAGAVGFLIYWFVSSNNATPGTDFAETAAKTNDSFAQKMRLFIFGVPLVTVTPTITIIPTVTPASIESENMVVADE